MLYTIIRKGGEYMAVSYSNRIRSLRKKLKMTQKQMAEQLFIDQSTLATYENRTREIPIDILVKLSKIYGISVDYLFCVSDFAVLDDALVRTQTKELIDSLSATQVFEVKGYIRRMIESKSEDE
ncbi:helix-turn-helix domain-containing protein [Ruminococcus sp.]|mgnify:CR=1 FL=1|jgi:bacteriophage CI repressor helix-turn-helix domain|uniref:helix-turn-helix domain-containing protein n=1 Tax=Ruminococcus sp. TaxID=41978 RepID=UPI003AB11F17